MLQRAQPKPTNFLHTSVLTPPRDPARQHSALRHKLESQEASAHPEVQVVISYYLTAWDCCFSFTKLM